MDRVNVAVIGLGMGRGHARLYHECPQANLVALCDVDTTRLNAVGDEFNVTHRFTSAEELFQLPGLHAVSVALPNFLHAPMTVAALKAGLHVLCEKPLAMNAGEAEAMVAAAKAANRQLMVHFNTRFSVPSMWARQMVDAGVVGPVYFGRTGYNRSRGIPGRGWFAIKAKSGGGPIIDIGVHRLDLALWLMDHPRPVTVSAATYAYLGTELAARQGFEFDVEDLAAGFIRFKNGATLTLEASWAGNTNRAHDTFTMLLGTRGGINIYRDEATSATKVSVVQEVGGSLVELSPKEQIKPPTAQAAFVRAILEGKPNPAPGEHGLAVQRILDALYRSAAEGREVPV
ncbi:MAG: Gfo/Idh/MocA family oxidoreductase [Armatimonadetes bacterium]|nr:Gfo/Idh/MocA family oxidoreductase [Armatimonadota bacterium]